jgi:signal transduction histidine kinase
MARDLTDQKGPSSVSSGELAPLEAVGDTPIGGHRGILAVRAARWFRVALWPLGLAAGIGAVWPSLSGAGLGVDDALYLLAGWSFIVSGLVGWARRPENRVGPIMVVTGFFWFAAALWAQTEGEILFTTGVVLRDFWTVLVVLLLVTFPSGRLGSRIDGALLAVFFAVLLPLNVLWLLFLEEATWNAFLVWPNTRVADAIDTAQRAILLAAIAGLMTMVVRRWLEAGAPHRRRLIPVVVGNAALCVYGLWLVVAWIRDEPAQLLGRISLLAFAFMPLVFLIGIFRARMARSAVAELVVELGAIPDPAGLRDALARSLRDPSLTLAFWLPEYEAYADLEGRHVELRHEDSGRATTVIDRDDEHVAVLLHDAALKEEPALLDAVSAAAGMALENARLQAELRARLEELRGSRARIVEAAQGERQRLERNLHDGAQQRLVAISLELGRLETRVGGDPATMELVERAKREATESLRELRELARGIHPALVTDHGLTVALEALVARSAIPIDLDIQLDRRLPEAFEVAAYYVVAEGITNVAKYAGATTTRVTVRRSGGRAVVEVVDDGVGGADTRGGSGLRGLADRLEALGGRLRVWSPNGGGTRVRAEMPCV